MSDPMRRQALAAFTMVLALSLLGSSIGRRSRPPVVVHVLRVDPNSSPAGVFEALPRIGPAMASRIIEERERAPFRDVDDLDRRVKGVGPATIAGIRPHLRFDPSPDR